MRWRKRKAVFLIFILFFSAMLNGLGITAAVESLPDALTDVPEDVLILEDVDDEVSEGLAPEGEADQTMNDEVDEPVRDEAEVTEEEHVVDEQEIKADAAVTEETEADQGTAITAASADVSDYTISGIAITPGRNESEINFAWYSPRGPDVSVVQFAKKSDMTGDVFPVDQATTFIGTVADAVEGLAANKVTVTGLLPSQQYVYRLGDGNDQHWSPVYDFNTQSTNDGYSFLMYGDPQIGAGNVSSDTEGWTNTVNKSLTRYPDVNFLVSVGDQVETATNERHYDGYFAPEKLKNYAVATVQGNHDNQMNYQYHFHTPNHRPEYISTNAGGNYYYTYGNTLFMVLNTNANSGAGHRAFMEEAIAENPDVDWKIVINHQSIYSSANHSTSSSMADLRANLFPVFDELDIDVVLGGHDHSYTRSHQMYGDQPQLNQVYDAYGRVVNPTGTLYITNNSASGSKYYNLRAPAPHEAVVSQPRVPTFSYVEVTDNSFSITAYITDTLEVVDSYTIVKDPSIAPPELENVILSADGDVLSTTASAVLPNDIELSLRGESESGFSVNLDNAPVEYKTNPEGVLDVSRDNKVTIAHPAFAGEVEIWAVVEYEGKQFISNKITVDVQHLTDHILVERGSEWNYLDDGSDQGIVWRNVDFDDTDWEKGAAPLGYPISESRPTFGSVATLIDYGPDAANKHATYYFRSAFTIDDLSVIGKKGIVQFGIDDGVVLYLNGHEIGRFNHPEGDVPYDKYLTDYSGFGVADEGRFETFALDETLMSYLVEGENVLTAEVRQDRPNSSDIYWDMEFITVQAFSPDTSQLAALTVEGGSLSAAFTSDKYEYDVQRTKEPLYILPTAFDANARMTINGKVVANQTPVEIPLDRGQITIIVTDSNGNSSMYKLHVLMEEELITKGGEWKYLDDGSDQYTSIEEASDWRHPDYDDSNWKSGHAILGYGGYEGEATTVGYGSSSSNKHITTYFRKTIDVENVDSYTELQLSVLRDDGAVVHLNGVEVFRSNMPSGEITHTTLAASTIGKDYTYYVAPIDPALLREGENVLAVSIHQDRQSSSDIAFDLDLAGKFSLGSAADPEVSDRTKVLEETFSEIGLNQIVEIDLRDEDEVFDGVMFFSEQIQMLIAKNAVLKIVNEDVELEIPAAIFEGDEPVQIMLVEESYPAHEALRSKIYQVSLFHGGVPVTDLEEDIIALGFHLLHPLNEVEEASIFFFNGIEWLSENAGHEYGGTVSEDRSMVMGTSFHTGTFAVLQVEGDDSDGEPEQPGYGDENEDPGEDVPDNNDGNGDTEEPRSEEDDSDHNDGSGKGDGSGSTDGSDDSNDSDGDKDGGTGSGNEQESNNDKGDDNGSGGSGEFRELPNTATNIMNLLVIGVTFVLAGIGLAVARRRVIL
ncbi:Cadherin-like beta sandwich domain-containing protein [Evansella caseinilytica]|uniref:Cadherin-like beta sandwich domain-containing protein n=1 Tax=Evansella caseinilytica TaxID=1503961 RepID=A0A1H3QWE7_9BACI|nr:fibronectin type III domain-containing protein [Evansella caseinilytica]SDZ17583.1 Cadherin-like beta sandwich domain-containing protein [Evansella caseinilytica]